MYSLTLSWMFSFGVSSALIFPTHQTKNGTHGCGRRSQDRSLSPLALRARHLQDHEQRGGGRARPSEDERKQLLGRGCSIPLLCFDAMYSAHRHRTPRTYIPRERVDRALGGLDILLYRQERSVVLMADADGAHNDLFLQAPRCGGTDDGGTRKPTHPSTHPAGTEQTLPPPPPTGRGGGIRPAQGIEA